MFANLLNLKRSLNIIILDSIFLASILIILLSSLSLAESNLPLRTSAETISPETISPETISPETISPETTYIGLPPTENGESLIAIDNELINSLTKVLQPLFKSLSLILGGIFGVYLIMVIFRLYYERKKVNLLKAILYDLDKLNEHYKINNSKSRQSWLKRVMSYLKKLFARNRGNISGNRGKK